MADEPENLVLHYLRRIDERVERIAADMQDLKVRVTSLEGQTAHLQTLIAAQSGPIDRIETRLERIERRLELTPAS
jgi:predicted nuclease with TOPRIM domain